MKRKRKHATFRYTMADVAAAIGIHPVSLSRYCSKNKIYILRYSLIKLIEFIIQERINRGYIYDGRLDMDDDEAYPSQ